MNLELTNDYLNLDKQQYLATSFYNATNYTYMRYLKVYVLYLV